MLLQIEVSHCELRLHDLESDGHAGLQANFINTASYHFTELFKHSTSCSSFSGQDNFSKEQQGAILVGSGAEDQRRAAILKF